MKKTSQPWTVYRGSSRQVFDQPLLLLCAGGCQMDLPCRTRWTRWLARHTPMVVPSLPPRWVYTYSRTFLTAKVSLHLWSYFPYHQGESTPTVAPSLPPRWVYTYGCTFLTTKVSLHLRSHLPSRQGESTPMVIPNSLITTNLSLQLWSHLPYHQGEFTPMVVPSLPPSLVYTHGRTFLTAMLSLHLRSYLIPYHTMDSMVGKAYTYGRTFLTAKVSLHPRSYLPYHQGESTPTVVPSLPPCWVYTHSSVVPSLPPRWVCTYGHTFLTIKVSLHLPPRWIHTCGHTFLTTKVSLHPQLHLPYHQGESTPTVLSSLPPRWVQVLVLYLW